VVSTAQHERPVDSTFYLPECLLWGLEEVIFNRNGLPALIQAYKGVLMALYSNDPVNPDIWPNPKFKMLILVNNWQ